MPELNMTYNAEKMELTISPIDAQRLHNIEEVVRCKDCQHWRSLYNWCDRKGIEMFERSFCSYGERRSDGV